MNDPHERIRRRAHEIWEREGRPDGKHDEHWSRAEREVQAEGGTATEDSSDTTAKRRGAAKGTRAAAQTISSVATGTGEVAAPAKGTRKSKAETETAKAPAAAKSGKPAKPAAATKPTASGAAPRAAKAPRAGRKDTQTDSRKGAAPH